MNRFARWIYEDKDFIYSNVDKSWHNYINRICQRIENFIFSVQFKIYFCIWSITFILRDKNMQSLLRVSLGTDGIAITHVSVGYYSVFLSFISFSVSVDRQFYLPAIYERTHFFQCAHTVPIAKWTLSIGTFWTKSGRPCFLLCFPGSHSLFLLFIISHPVV